MLNFTEEVNTNFNFPNIDIYNQIKDGVCYGYRVYAHNGYMMYDKYANDTEAVLDENGVPKIDPTTMLVITKPVTHYVTMAGLPITYNFDDFQWVAVEGVTTG